MRTNCISAVMAILIGVSGAALGAERAPTVFVGAFVKMEPVKCESGEFIDEAGQEMISICMDALFKATYRVEKVLEGKLVPGEEVVFSVADHYGFPKFAEQKRALLFLKEHEGRYYHVKYLWEHAFRTSDGDFAQCGCDVEDSDGDMAASSDCRVLSFSPAVTQDLTHSSQHVIDEIRAAGNYRVQGNRAECVRGVMVEDLYKNLRPDLMSGINR